MRLSASRTSIVGQFSYSFIPDKIDSRIVGSIGTSFGEVKTRQGSCKTIVIRPVDIFD